MDSRLCMLELINSTIDTPITTFLVEDTRRTESTRCVFKPKNQHDSHRCSVVDLLGNLF